MHGETIEITMPDGVADAYVATPDDDGDHPGVLLMPDAFGLRAEIEHIADRIASHGYVVLAPNHFYRHGRAPLFDPDATSDPERRMALVRGEIMPLILGYTSELIVRDAAAYLDALERRSHSPFGITGYCMGGRAGWYIAAANPDRIAALGSFHAAHLVVDAPDSPHLLAGDLRAELFLGHADNDEGMTPDDVATVERALDDAGVTYRSELFEGAAHGYVLADSPTYDEQAAERHFTELLALLDRAVAAEPAAR